MRDICHAMKHVQSQSGILLCKQYNIHSICHPAVIAAKNLLESHLYYSLGLASIAVITPTCVE